MWKVHTNELENIIFVIWMDLPFKAPKLLCNYRFSYLELFADFVLVALYMVPVKQTACNSNTSRCNKAD